MKASDALKPERGVYDHGPRAGCNARQCGLSDDRGDCPFAGPRKPDDAPEDDPPSRSYLIVTALNTAVMEQRVSWYVDHGYRLRGDLQITGQRLVQVVVK